MNSKVLAIETLKKLIREYPDYSMGEILYSFLRLVNEGEPVGWMLELTDDNIYKALEKSLRDEKED